MADEEIEVSEEVFTGGEISLSEDAIVLDDEILLDLGGDEDDDSTDFGLSPNSLDD